MKAAELKRIAEALVGVGAPGLPTLVLTREVPLFEVDFAALEFAEEAKLTASDWAALALARALGEVSPADIDAYLGLGEAVSEGLVQRLMAEALLEQRAEEDAAAPNQEPGIRDFFQRLFGSTLPSSQAAFPPNRARTAARPVRTSRASSSPLCRPSAGGLQALARGVVAQRRVRPARALFLAEPLLFLGVIDEKRQRYTQYRRPNPLEPDRVPASLRELDSMLALPPAERQVACGIESHIREFPGQLVGVVPGTQWEVRPHERRSEGRSEWQSALLVLAAFPSSDVGGLRWRAYLRQQEHTQDCPHVDAVSLLDQDLRTLPGFLRTIEADILLPKQESLRRDGAFELRCGTELLPELLGEADRPDDTFLPALADNWWVGLRAHAMPSDLNAGRAAFYEFLRRRDASLRRDFDGTCADVGTKLMVYWGENPGLPSADDAAVNLWPRAELRAALCMRRRHRDLVAPYEHTEKP